MEVAIFLKPFELLVYTFSLEFVRLDGEIAFVLISDQLPKLFLDFDLGESVFEIGVFALHKKLEVVLDFLIGEECKVVLRFGEVLFGKL